MEKMVYLIRVVNDNESVTWMGKNGTKICDPWSYQLFDFAKANGFETESDAYSTPNSIIYDEFEDQAVVPRVVGLLVW